MNPDWLVLGSAWLSGLLGGVHCAAMCGGIATAFPAMGNGRGLRAALEPNLGRIAGYTVAGAIGITPLASSVHGADLSVSNNLDKKRFAVLVQQRFAAFFKQSAIFVRWRNSAVLIAGELSIHRQSCLRAPAA